MGVKKTVNLSQLTSKVSHPIPPENLNRKFQDPLFQKVGSIQGKGLTNSKVKTTMMLFQSDNSVAQSCLTLCEPMDLQHARLPYPSPTAGAYSNSCPLSQWCHPTISSSDVPFSSHLQCFPASVFSRESVIHIRWPKYWSFSFSIRPFNEYSGFISFRMDSLDLLTEESSPTPWFKSINSSALSFLYGPTLTSIHNSWKNHSFD